MAERSGDALSVGAALALAKHQLEGVSVRIVGEVSEVSNKPGYAAVYFTLKDKDQNASLPCLMWMNRFKQAGVDIRVGAVVDVTGRFSLYAAKGRMNFDVSTITLAGEGDIRMKMAQLAKKLEAEGLMRPEAKRPLPRLPRRIGLVTSPRGAAVYDVLRTLRRRYPLASVLVTGVPVEGKDAPAHLMAGLDEVVAAGAEVVLLVRGGGSFEDLMPFNDEALARHIASLPVPIVTGIGHEPDTSIADMVADLRASTPTAAAEAVAPQSGDIQAALDGMARRMGFAESALASSAEKRLSVLAASPVFADPMALLRDDAQRLDEASRRLEGALPGALAKSRDLLASARMSFLKASPRLLGSRMVRLTEVRTALRAAGPALATPFKERIAVMAAGLEGLSPLAVLSRGYAAAFSDDGAVISSIHSVTRGDVVNVQVSDGLIACRAEDIRSDAPGKEKVH